MRELRIVYMGTPDFAVYPLQKLLEAGHKVVAVVTKDSRVSREEVCRGEGDSRVAAGAFPG